jgi:excisionase family DNA binding protein
MNQVIVTSKDELENIILLSVRKVLGEQRNYNEAQDNDPMFSIKEACAFLNLAQQTLYGFTSKREIPFIKRGKKLYFRKSELNSWLLEGKKKSKSELLKELE